MKKTSMRGILRKSIPDFGMRRKKMKQRLLGASKTRKGRG